MDWIGFKRDIFFFSSNMYTRGRPQRKGVGAGGVEDGGLRVSE